jgi:hypothetical protein
MHAVSARDRRLFNAPDFDPSRVFLRLRQIVGSLRSQPGLRATAKSLL